MQTILTTQQRTRLLQEADPGYLDVLREQWQQRCTDNRLLSVADRIRYLEETAIPELLAGNIVTEAGQYAYAGPLDRLDDALENALAAPARGRRRRVLWLLIPAVLLFWLGFTLLGSDDTTAATTTALGSGECAGEADGYGSSVRPGQPLFVEVAAHDTTYLFCVVNIEGDKHGNFKELPEADTLTNHAAWLADTWVRPVFGVTGRLLDAITSGDTVTIRTGDRTWVYTISVVYAVDRRQVATLLDQAQQPGLLLFSLPADGATVQLAEGVLDEQVAVPAVYPVGQPFTYRDVAIGEVAVTTGEAPTGSLLVTARATLATDRETPVELVVRFQDSDGIITYPQGNGIVRVMPGQPQQATWSFVLPDKPQPGAALAFVENDALPALVLFDVVPPEQRYELLDVAWDAAAREVVTTLRVSSDGEALLEAGELRVVQQGGDVAVRIDPVLPLAVTPDAPVTVVLRFRPTAPLATVLTEDAAWLELSDLPP
ncbi:MAG: hypothetical protein M9965_12310 [Anaerolineae bacterium]|nr:hypothetical protein [Anaerolineae bacterium]